MSNRSLFEFNHDLAHQIESDPEGFVRALMFYLNSGAGKWATGLQHFGLTYHGMRHHSDGFHLEWGSCVTEERPTPDTPAPPAASEGTVEAAEAIYRQTFDDVTGMRQEMVELINRLAVRPERERIMGLIEVWIPPSRQRKNLIAEIKGELEWKNDD